MEVLLIAATFCEQENLKDWCLAAGFVRNLVWDKLHHHSISTALDDVDLIYFDAHHTSPKRDFEFESQLRQVLEINWSVKNQARMHLRNDDQPYVNSCDAMSYWPEVETAVGVYLDRGALKVISPFDLACLFAGTITLNPKRPKIDAFYQRIAGKQWLEKWPHLRVSQTKF